jgi:hypothetical protein
MERNGIQMEIRFWMDDVNNFTFTSTNGGPNGLWKYDYEGKEPILLGS